VRWKPKRPGLIATIMAAKGQTMVPLGPKDRVISGAPARPIAEFVRRGLGR